MAEEIVSAVFDRYGRGHSGEMLLVLTDRDMYIRQAPWRFAFAMQSPASSVAVVSLARMDPGFPLVAPGSYEPRAPACPALLNARAYKMITRQILRGVCETEPVDDPRSLRRSSVLSVPDLDAMEEDRY